MWDLNFSPFHFRHASPEIVLVVNAAAIGMDDPCDALAAGTPYRPNSVLGCCFLELSMSMLVSTKAFVAAILSTA